MALVTVKPTQPDIAIADGVGTNTNPDIERAVGALTWGADEHVLLALVAAGWLYVRFRSPEKQPVANHVLAVSLVAAALPHVLKSAVDQIRPDRLTVRAHRRGVPLAGRARDAFPSGHAVHMGALASAAGLLPPRRRQFARGLAVALSLTRIALLAHWASDVLAGFAFGVVIERMMRPWTLSASHRHGIPPKTEP